MKWRSFCFVLFVTTGTVGTGCASRGTTLTESGILKAVTRESGEISFTDFYAVEEDQKLVLAGALRRRDGLRISYGGHVDLAIMDSEGNTLISASTNINPKIIRRARESYFKARFNLQPPQGGKIFAAFHVPERQLDEIQFDCGNNRALVPTSRD